MSSYEVVKLACPDCREVFEVTFFYEKAVAADGGPSVTARPDGVDFHRLVEHVAGSAIPHPLSRAGQRPIPLTTDGGAIWEQPA